MYVEQVIIGPEISIIEVLVEDDISIVEIIGLGPQGPVAPPTNSFSYSQSSASAVWTIAHNLGRYPVVLTRTLGGVEIHGDVQYLSNNIATVTFSVPIAGFAYLI